MMIAALFLVHIGASSRLAAQTLRPPDPVQISTADGLEITGYWLAGDPGAPAVLLLHDAGRDHHGYRPLWDRLRREGVHVLALDFRGHGTSMRTTQEAYERMARRDADAFRALIHDAEAGVRFLTEVHGVPQSRIAVVGAATGCNVGFELMARRPQLPCMVALSPSLLAHGLNAGDHLGRYGRRPLLIVSTKKLLHAGPQAIHDRLSKTTDVRLEVFVGEAVRGTDLLGQRIDVEGLIVAWLQGNLFHRR
jgi:alpha-beta hydrolase superfamily lysophospholipase